MSRMLIVGIHLFFGVFFLDIQWVMHHEIHPAGQNRQWQVLTVMSRGAEEEHLVKPPEL